VPPSATASAAERAAPHRTCALPQQRRVECGARMQTFRHDGIEIAYLDEGEGDPIVLIHGFASTAAVNWVAPGWVATLTKARRRAIALDNRGHGASAQLYDPAAYHSASLAEGVRGLRDPLGVAPADVLGT